MLLKAIIMLVVFNVGVVVGVSLNALLSTNKREEEIGKAYKKGFRDCMDGKAPKSDVR